MTVPYYMMVDYIKQFKRAFTQESNYVFLI